ncbi:cinnamoyl-CoA reductase 1-like [Vigna radiata var. radiata]|uniref:Cinnamoyl-CoA reductase 1-like n=1 Tax=Vigna radiata var. radiata TaxID=3916 RepID=A0A3Q0END0_VIGRR|nr:cinnamoyl-CoA reductase 1-like [Vigna radiata var. radiata]
MSSNIEKVVCVTGASGFIASWIVKFLLQRGYTVRATVRNPANHEKVDHLLKLDGAKERLHLYKADLLEEGSFDDAFEGCYGVFHTASPVQSIVNDPQKELIDPAVKGTLNVVKSCAKSTSVKRIVLTSSFAAVSYNGRPRAPEVVVDETWFSDPNILRENEKWYSFGKTLAEDAARKCLDEQDIKLIVINPAMTIGPLLQQEMNETSSRILNLINGSKTLFPNLSFGWVNVKDAANAHVQAYESDSASGRYCLVERVAHFSEIVNILGQMYPTLQIADKCEDDEPFVPTYQVSKEKAKSLGIEFISLEDSLRETVECFKEKKLLDF